MIAISLDTRARFLLAWFPIQF